MLSRGNCENFLGRDFMLDRIKSLCEAKGTNINQLEIKCGLSTGAIRHWNTSVPKADKAYLAAKELGVSVEYLLTGKETPAAKSDGLDEVMDFLRSLPVDRLRGILLALEAPAEVIAALDRSESPK